MGSVLDNVVCPNCGSIAYNDFYYNTNENYMWCTDCGYYHTYELIYKNGKSEDVFEEKILEKPYGYCTAYRTAKFEGIIEKEYHKIIIGNSIETEEVFYETMKEMIKDPELETIHLSRYINNKIILKEVFNRKKYERVQKLRKIESYV